MAKKSYEEECSLVIYDSEDVQRIFKLQSISSARRLMNHPAFPLMRIGRALLVTEDNLKKFIKDNGTSFIDLEYKN